MFQVQNLLYDFTLHVCGKTYQCDHETKAALINRQHDVSIELLDKYRKRVDELVASGTLRGETLRQMRRDTRRVMKTLGPSIVVTPDTLEEAHYWTLVVCSAAVGLIIGEVWKRGLIPWRHLLIR